MTPGPLDARVGHDERARAAGRGDHLGECARSRRPRTGPGCAGSSRTGGRPGVVTRRTSSTVSVEVSRRTVSQRRQPAAWNQRSVVGPSGLSKTQTSSKSRSSGSVIQSGTGRRSPPNVNSSIGRRPQRGTGEPEHQRVPAEPWSASTWSRRKRSSANGAISAGGRPVAISSAMPSPPAGIALKPHVPQPVVTRKPSTPVGAHDRASSRRRCRRSRPTSAGSAGRAGTAAAA